MKNLILTPNPYRDRNFHTLRSAMQILKEAGFQVKPCLPFEVERSCELPRDIHFYRLDRELGNADLVICFGGDGTILHIAKAATRRGLPLLGVNIGTMGFMAELESTELEKLKLLAGQAFRGVYDEKRVSDQLETFLRRFFSQQFKRNCVPDGPKVGSVSLSPRGDWRMPSDMSRALWKA